MHETHRRAAELHELAAKAHRTAAEHNEKGDDEAGRWHEERALSTRTRPTKLRKKRTANRRRPRVSNVHSL